MKILLINSNSQISNNIIRTLENYDFQVKVVTGFNQAFESLQSDDYQAVMCDQYLIKRAKLDLVKDQFRLKRYLKDFKNSVAISALRGTNIRQLLEQLSAQLEGLMTEIEVLIPQDKMYLLDLIYRQGQVFKQNYQKDQVYLQARVPQKVKGRLENLLQKNI